MDGIMVSAATGAMNSVLDKLTTLLADEYKLEKGMKCDITFLKDELSNMNALLEKLADTELLDPQMKVWRNQVREMAYDIEDCIDVYLHRLQHEPDKPRGIKGFFWKSIKKVKKLGARHGIAEQIQELKAQIIEASRRRKRYKLDEVAFSGGTDVVAVDPRLPALYAEAASLIGIDVPRDELIKLVNDGNKQLKVVSIMGFGGLGKTTLANQVYQKIGVRFDCQAFVPVSQKPDMRKILLTILSQIKKQEYASTGSGDEEWLIDALRDFLKGKRYLIVIDDIWSTQAWKTIKCGLPDDTCGSRIILTTRIASVAKLCCSPRDDLVYVLRPLSEADSKTLFFRRIFGSEDKCPPHLEGVSIEIIRKCGGLPLAIVTMASLLTTKSDAREEWISVQKSIGLGLEKHPDVEEMKRILSLSYNDLPYHLKTCLLYLSMYPEDYEIQLSDLVRRWIAEGFIKVNGGRSLQEVGRFYFNELINRNMIQPVIIKYDGQVCACRVHDMILDLIVSKAVEENFVTSTGDHTHTLVSQSKVRRLSLDYRGQENVAMLSIATAHVRSLSVFGYCETMPSLLDFQALRVLALESVKELENCYMENIAKLFQLRYLRIQASGLTQLPEEIGKLHVLETLDLRHTGIRELPASIVKMRQLKHLLVDYVKLPDGVGNMQAMEELSDIAVDQSTSIESLQELGSLTKLRILILQWGISDLDNNKTTYGDIFVSSISKLGKSSLRSLEVDAGFLNSLDFLLDYWSPPPHLLQNLDFRFNGSVCKIPVWMASLANLTRLRIKVNPVRQETLNILGDLPALIFLQLQAGAADHKERLIVGTNRFRCLKVFRFNFHSPVGLMFEAGAMPKLETLSLTAKADEAQSDAACGAPDLGISRLLALKDLHFWIVFARVEEADALEAAIRNAASLLPNRPTQRIYRIFTEQKMGQDDASREEETHEVDDTKQRQETSADNLKAQPSSTTTSAASSKGYGQARFSLVG